MELDGVEVAADNVDLFRELLTDATDASLEEIGLVAERYAKAGCPVATGRLRNSITHVVDAGDKAAIIGTNVEYAVYVEKGTSKQKAQPYLTPAATQHGSTYRAILKKHLGGA